MKSVETVETIEFQQGLIADVQPGIQVAPHQVDERSLLREPQQEIHVLLDSTLTWMAHLPKDVRPMMLARLYPRIANKLADIWRRVARCEEYLDTLVVDLRGNRAGFPPDVARELNNLRGYYAELHPDNHSGWNQIGAAS